MQSIALFWILFYNNRLSKLLLHTVYPPIPASGDAGQGYTKLCISINQLDVFNKVDVGLLLFLIISNGKAHTYVCIKKIRPLIRQSPALCFAI